MRILSEYQSTPWAMLPGTLALMHQILGRWASGVRLSAEEIGAAIGMAPAEAAARRERDANAGGGFVAVLPVLGVVSQRASMISDVSSGAGTSTENLRRDLKAAANNPAIKAIVLDIDSPGGSVYGVPEAAADIRAAGKPVTAVVDSLAASAAYWLASAADEIVITPSGGAGSIGVYAAHVDMSAELEKIGEKVTLISAGRYKTEGNPYEPLSEEARAAMQADVDGYYQQFVGAVANYRGTTPAAVQSGYGEGRVLRADDAVRAGLADRIGTLDQVLADLQRQRPGRSTANARRRLDLLTM